MNSFKYLIKRVLLLVMLVFAFINSNGQSECFENLGEVSGIDKAIMVSELEAASCDFIASYPSEYQSSFKIYDFGYYSHSEVFDDDNDKIWDDLILKVSTLSTYYVLIGKVSDRGGIYNEAKIVYNLPVDQSIDCTIDGSNYDFANSIINNDLSVDKYISNFKKLLTYFESKGVCEDCGNGEDDDGDGFPDCKDLDCFSQIYGLKGNTKNSDARVQCNTECMDVTKEEIITQLDTTKKIDIRIEELRSGGYWDKLDRIFDFVHCEGGDWAPRDPDGVIPECLWNYDGGSPSRAYLSGLVDGGSKEIKGLISFVKNFKSKGEMFMNFVVSAVLVAKHGCKPFLELDKICNGNFTEYDLKFYIDKKFKELNVKGHDDYFKNYNEYDIRQDIIPDLMTGCGYKKQIDDLIATIDLHKLIPELITKIQGFLSDLTDKELTAWYDFGLVSGSVIPAMIGSSITKISQVSKFLGLLKSAPNKFMVKFCILGRGCFVEDTPVLMANKLFNSDSINEGLLNLQERKPQSGKVGNSKQYSLKNTTKAIVVAAAMPVVAIPIQEVQLLDYAVAHETVNSTYGLTASTDDNIYLGLMDKDPFTSDQQRERDEYEINDTDWNEVVFEEINGGSIAKLALHKDWINDKGYQVFAVVNLDLPEQGINGPFRITSIKHIIPQKKPVDDDETDDYDYKPVMGLFTHESNQVYDISFDNGEELGVTYQHPIYSVTAGNWRLAGELEVGELVLTKEGNTKVVRTTKNLGSDSVYNLEIKELHNFLVNESGIIVHNSCWDLLKDVFKIFNVSFDETIKLPGKKWTYKVRSTDQTLDFEVDFSEEIGEKIGKRIALAPDGAPGIDAISEAGKVMSYKVMSGGSLNSNLTQLKDNLSTAISKYKKHHSDKGLPVDIYVKGNFLTKQGALDNWKLIKDINVAYTANKDLIGKIIYKGPDGFIELK